MIGTVLWGVNNIYTVLEGERSVECRIKGKILKDAVGAYNPLAPGDRVDFSINDDGSGSILSRFERRNAFIRFNKKRRAPQTVAANVDLVVCVCSPANPPFRPRFIDRVTVAALGIPILILVNKIDLGMDETVARRLAVFSELGFGVESCSAKSGAGLDRLREAIDGKQTVFVGQSGVGKSTVLNALAPGAGQKVGEVSTKYDRGRHTTTFGVVVPWDGGTIIDTPGIREIEIAGIDRRDLMFYFPEFEPYIPECRLRNCRHVHEPGCAVERAVEQGDIHPDRFESYERIYDALPEDWET